MEQWDVGSLELEAHRPQILSSDDGGRAIAIALPAGERLQEHEVHEHAVLVVVAGEVELSTPGGGRASGGAGLVARFGPGERHEVTARSDARLLLVLSPWPGEGHPGAMTLEEKSHARERARERAGAEDAGSA